MNNQVLDNKSIIHHFLDSVNQAPNQIALVFEEQNLTFKRVYQLVTCLVSFLVEKGLKKGDRCLVSLNNSIEFALLFLAAAEIEFVLVPVANSLKLESLQTALLSTDATFLFSTELVLNNYLSSDLDIGNVSCININLTELKQLVSQQIHFKELGLKKNSLNSDFILTMTSGSTGRPKPIVLTQRTELLRSFDGTKYLYNLTEEVVITASPMYHSLAQRLVLLPLMTSGTAIILKRFNVIHWLKSVERY